MNHPTHVPGLMRSHNVRCLRFGAAAEQRLDDLHRLNQPGLSGGWDQAQHGRDFRTLAGVERGKGFSAASGQTEEALAAVGFRCLPANQAVLFKFAQNTAEIAGVESQFLAEFSGGGPLAMRDLVQNAHFCERKRALEKTFAQHADLPGVKAVEAANSDDVLIDSSCGPGCHIVGSPIK